ncbi:MAG: class I SAM-dependent methyltransferase [Nanoarchaeota archaeon]
MRHILFMHLDYTKIGGSESYFWFKGKYQLSKLLTKKFAPGKNHRILLVGGGMGAELKILQQHGKTDIIDIDAESLTHVPRQSCDQIFHGDITDYPLQKGYYDLAIAYDVIEHVKHHRAALNNIFASLKPGGLFIMNVPAHNYLFSGHDTAAGHFRRYSLKDVKHVVHEAGFRIKFISYWNFFLSPLFLVYRGLSKMSRKKGYDYIPFPPAVNAVLAFPFTIENYLIAHGIPLPYGISIITVLERPRRAR